MRLLSFTTLYPNALRPNHGVFVENRLRHLVGTGQVTATVLAPIRWSPGRASAPSEEFRHGIRVLHPPWLAGLGGTPLAPWLLYLAARRAVGGLLAAGRRFDAIDAHYLYPDGVAAVWLGRQFGLPVAVTARGSDVTQFPNHLLPRVMIRRAVLKADAVITVSAGLRDALAALGIPPDRMTVLRNGVDLHMFAPQDPAAARRTYGVAGRTLVSVGSLIERKGHHRTIEALTHLPGWELVIAGEGPERARLLALAARLGVGARVRLLGPVPHAELAALYSAADLSVLASSREGWANVLLELMACGTPVIASPIPGNPEVVQARSAGLIAKANTAEALAAAVLDWAEKPGDRAETRAYAELFGWDATSQGQLAIFKKLTRS